MTLIDETDALLLDLDGTVWEGPEPIPEAVPAIRSAGLPALYVTNNASRSGDEVAGLLNGMGLSATGTDVLTSAEVAVELARRELPAGVAVLVVGAPSFRELAGRAGFQVVEDAEGEPAAVLQGHFPGTGWAQLTEAALAIRTGARYIASNLDTTLPTPRGLAVGNGAMVAAVVAATGVHPVVAGKPEPAPFRLAAERLGAERPLAVGDRLDTDIRGGNAAGITTLHVMTGISGHRAVLSAEPRDRPTLLGADLRALQRDAGELRPAPCGGFRARMADGALVISGGDAPDPMAALRTAAHLAWSRPVAFAGEVRAEGDVAAEAIGAWR